MGENANAEARSECSYSTSFHLFLIRCLYELSVSCNSRQCAASTLLQNYLRDERPTVKSQIDLKKYYVSRFFQLMRFKHLHKTKFPLTLFQAINKELFQKHKLKR